MNAKLLVSLGGLLGLSILGIAIFSGTTQAQTLRSHYTARLKSTINDKSTLEYINGKAIHNALFTEYEAGVDLISELNGQTAPSTSRVLDKFNNMEIEYLYAKSKGLEISLSTAKKYALHEEELLSHPSANDVGATRVEKIIRAEEKGLGISNAQYWNSFAPKWYQIQMTDANLENHVIQSDKTDRSIDSNQLSSDIRNIKWKKFVEDLRDKYKVQIITSSFTPDLSQ